MIAKPRISLYSAMFIALTAIVPTAAAVDIYWPPLTLNASSIQDWIQQYIGTISYLFNLEVPYHVLAPSLPRLSLDFNAKANKVLHPNTPPNYNTKFDAIEGVSSSIVKWFTECDDRQPDDPVVLYLHGGGYGQGLNPLFASDLNDLYTDVNDPRLSIVWVDYTLSFEAPYPTQLREATAIYNELAKTCNNIILEGDSAGGHLALGMLRTMLYPVNTVDSLSGIPAGLALLSPAVTFAANPNNGTMEYYRYQDYLNAPMLNGMGELLVNNDSDLILSTELSPWKDHIDWKKIMPEPSKIFTEYGEHEVLRDAIESWLTIALGGITSETTGSEVRVDPRGTHDAVAAQGRACSQWPYWIQFHKRFFNPN